MFKKHYPPNLIVLLLVISSIIYFGLESYRIVAMCNDALASTNSSSRRDFRYEYIDFLGSNYRPMTVLFDFRGDTAFCHVRRNGLGWKVDEEGLFGISPLP